MLVALVEFCYKSRIQSRRMKVCKRIQCCTCTLFRLSFCSSLKYGHLTVSYFGSNFREVQLLNAFLIALCTLRYTLIWTPVHLLIHADHVAAVPCHAIKVGTSLLKWIRGWGMGERKIQEFFFFPGLSWKCPVSVSQCSVLSRVAILAWHDCNLIWPYSCLKSLESDCGPCANLDLRYFAFWHAFLVTMIVNSGYFRHCSFAVSSKPICPCSSECSTLTLTRRLPKNLKLTCSS